MKNRIKIIGLLLLFFVGAKAQLLNPVTWNTAIEKKSDTQIVLVFNAIIEENWHLFSQFTPQGASLPTVFDFKEASNNYKLIGKTTESNYKKIYNPVFEVNEYVFENKAQFKQTLQIINPELQTISVTINYQACKESCVQENKTFVFTIPQTKNTATTHLKSQTNTDTTTANTTITDTTKATIVQKQETEANLNKTRVLKTENKTGLFSIFFIAFLSGFAALLTPCVFPMIPMTVSFFTKQSKTRANGIKNALTYGLSIIIIYVLLGTLVTAIFGADALNALSTNVWFNLGFFILLVVFAASFLGAFEIMLPNSWANSIDKQADRGGIIGILFMALALAIVSFSCTGPIVGTLLVEAASKGGIAPIVGMLGFSLALALPFMLFAMFPGWLQSLPKSGGWLTNVKAFLGFLELALAFKFLSNADLVLQNHWLERELFIAIWIAIFGVMALYLLGKITLPHDTPVVKLSVPRLFMGLLALTFTIYLIPGLWGAPLKLISGFPPPQTYSESPNGFGSTVLANEQKNIPKGAKIGAHNMITFTDYAQGMAYAKTQNKPVLLDFTGFACVNCRKMEDYIWSKPEILSILKNEIVLISLYVDDKKELPENQKYISKTTGKQINTIGNKWSDFQITKYKANAQPYYILIDLQEKSLNTPIGYTPNSNTFKKWLQEGISKF